MYGTLWKGGQYGRGSIFAADRLPDGSLVVTTVYEFSGPDGAELYGDPVIGPDGRIYGTAMSGGANNQGTIWAFDPSASTFHVLKSMESHATTGIRFFSGLTSVSDGNLYGTNDSHKVFRITPAGDFTVIATLMPTDGQNVRGALVEGTDGHLYGTARAGGANSRGTIFRVTTTGIVTTLYSFTNATGSIEGGVMKASDGYFYGTTLTGGAFGGGIIYRIDSGGAFSVIHDFANATGVNPEARLIEASDGLLYGTTRGGGTQNRGAVFRIGKGGSPAYSLVQSITFSVGQSPAAGLLQTTAGDFYGTTTEVVSLSGVIFRMPPAADGIATVYSFSRSAMKLPIGSLAEAPDGSFYGATIMGGTQNWGTIFRLDSSGSVSLLHSFTFPTGAQPLAGPIVGADGRLYGTTSISGASGAGVIYRMNVDGSGYTVLHSFNNATGSSPAGGLTLTADGNIYGTASLGGPQGLGSLFRVTPAGAVSFVHTFSGGAAGSRPYGELLYASDGFLYGTTSGESGGTLGTIYRIDTAGTVTTVHVFSGSDGAVPYSGLAEGSDGNFYGVTTGGGVGNLGVVYRMTPGGVVSTVMAFPANGTMGASPRASLLASRDGRLYGLTRIQGAFGGGTLFRLNPRTGQARVLHHFEAGSQPSWRLAEPAGDEALVGVALGGATSGGVIYRFVPDRPPVGVADTFTTTEDTPLSVAGPGVLGNDVDEGALTATLVMPTPVNHGTVTLNADGSFTFTPATNFNGTTSFTYVAADALDESDPVTVTIEVTPVNDAPVLTGTSVGTNEDTPANGVLSWTDADDTSVTFRIVTAATRGSAVIDPNTGAFTYTPNANANGSDDFAVVANDGEADSAPATVSVQIAPVNDAPVATPQSLNTPEDTALSIMLAGTDVDGDPLTYAVSTPPSRGTLSGTPASPTYTPLPNYHGADIFTFTVSDGELASAAAVTITVAPSNDAPIAAGQSLFTVEDTPLSLTLWGSDLEGQSLTYGVVTGPANGSLSGAAPNLVYTPAQNFRGSDSFSFTASDGTAASAPATVTISVVGERFVRASPDVTTVFALAVSPVDPSIVYAGVGHGVFRSTDGGATWARSTSDFLLTGIAVHPTTPTTLYASASGGVRRSVDGGATFSFLGGTSASGIVIDPTRPDTLYTRGNTGAAVMKSTNSGVTWTPQINGFVVNAGAQVIVTGLAVDPVQPSRLFATLANGGGVHRSTDGGETWQRIAFAGSGGSDVVIDSRGNSAAFVAVGGRVKRSVDGGDTWVDVHGGITGQASRLAIEPSTGVLYASNELGVVFTSTDGGGSWMRFINDMPTTGVASIVTAPTVPGTVYVAQRFGVFKSTDGSQTWTRADQGIANLEVRGLLGHALDPLKLFAASEPGLFATGDGGATWSPSMAASARNRADLAADPLDPNIVYLATNTPVGVYRTADGGATWLLITSGFGPSATVEDLAVDASTGDIYAGVGTGGVYKSIDRGLSWVQSSAGLPASVWSLAASSTSPVVLYAGTTSGVYRSMDAAATWEVKSAGLPTAQVRGLAVDPTNALVAYAAVNNPGIGIYKTINGGESWFRLTSAPSPGIFGDILIDPRNPLVLYIAGNANSGISRSLDGGMTWQQVNTGLPHREILRIALSADFTLYVSLVTEGVWKLQTAANDPPTAQAQSATTAEDTPVPIVLTASDPDGESLTFAVVDGPSHGTLSGSGANLTYTPAPNYHGSDTFTFTASDGQATSNTATVSITVTPVNDAPVAQAGSVALDEDTSAPLTLTAADVDGDVLTFTIVSGPTHGTLNGSSPNYSYTPAPNYNGSDAVTFRATDPSGLWSEATISIAVAPVNDAPVPLSQSLTTPEDTPLPITLSATDIDGDSLVFSIASGPLKGTVTGTGASRIYTPLPNFRDADSFTFAVSDGTLTQLAVISISVTAANDAPIAAAQTVQTVEDTSVAITLWGSDLDGDPVTYNVVSGPTHGTLSGNAPNLTFTPAQNYRGSDSFTFKVNDGALDSNVATVNITVTGEQFVLASPGVSVVRAIAVSPVNSSIVYAGAQRGFFRSTDGGVSWHRSNVGFEVSSIALHPTTPTTVYSAGFSFGSVRRSTDGGANWQALNAPSSSRVVLDPSRPDTLYAFGFAPNAVSKSTDGGGSWASRATGLAAQGQISVTGAAIDPVNPSRLFVSLVNGGGVFRTVDGGDSWQRVGFAGQSASDVAIDPRGNAIIYAAVNGRVQKSTNAGDSWADVHVGISGSAVRFAIDAGGAVYVTTAEGHVWVSPNGGGSWVRHTNTLPQVFIAAIAVDPVEPGVLYAGSQFNLYKSTNGSQTWTQADAGLVTLTAHAVLPSRTQPNVVFAATNAGTFRSADGGATWSLSHPLAFPNSVTMLQDPLTPEVFYLAPGVFFFSGQALLYRTNDGGETWAPLNPALPSTIRALAADPTLGTLYAALNSGGVYKSTNGGSSWTSANGGLPSTVLSVASAPNASALYAGTPSAGVYRSLDGGISWHQQSNGIGAQSVNHIAIDPTVPDTVYATVSGGNHGVYKTTNSGASWSRLSLNTGSSSYAGIRFDPAAATTLYVGTGNGLGRSQDGGLTWQVLSSGLPHLELSTIGVGADSAVYAAPGAAGIWKYAVAANDAPVATGQSVTTVEDTPSNVTLAATDPDSEPVTFSIVTGPAHGTLTLNGASVVYTPAANYYGPDSFTFKANDGQADSNVAMVPITVTPVNDAPVANDDSLSTNEDTPLTIPAAALLGNDVDVENGSLTVAIETGPSMGTLAANPDGSFTFTPSPNVFGSATFTYRASDGSLSSNLATVTITVLPVNDAPVALNGSLTVNEDTAGNGVVVAADIDTPLLSYTVFSNGAKGTATIEASTGAFTYTPSANENGADAFVIAVSDGQFTVHATVAVTINAVNDAPVAADGSVSTNEDVVVSGSVSATDVDSSSLTYSIVANGSKGTAVITDPSTGAFTYTPQLNANGPDSFTFRASDGTAQSQVTIVQVTINAVNDAPVAVAVALAAPKQVATAGGLIATDVDGDPLTYTMVQPPAQGSVTVNSNGTFTYTSSASASGTDTFTYVANDGTVNSAPATVSIAILSSTGAPLAFDASLAATEDTPAAGTLTGGAQAGRPLTYSLDGAASKGTVVITNATTGAFLYTPNPNENGEDAFTFRLSDGVQTSNRATITITIAPVNDAPVATAGALAVTEDRSADGILIGSDVDGQPLTFELVGTPTQGTVEITNPATGRYTYTPNANAFGADSFTFRVSDGVASSTATVGVTISNVNDGPTAEDVSFTTTVNTALAGTLPASDPDNDPLTFEVRRNPRYGTVTLNVATGQFVYTPNAGFSGSDTFTFRVSDGIRNSLVATVTITVRPN